MGYLPVSYIFYYKICNIYLPMRPIKLIKLGRQKKTAIFAPK